MELVLVVPRFLLALVAAAFFGGHLWLVEVILAGLRRCPSGLDKEPVRGRGVRRARREAVRLLSEGAAPAAGDLVSRATLTAALVAPQAVTGASATASSRFSQTVAPIRSKSSRASASSGAAPSARPVETSHAP